MFSQQSGRNPQQGQTYLGREKEIHFTGVPEVGAISYNSRFQVNSLSNMLTLKRPVHKRSPVPLAGLGTDDV